IEPLRRVVAAHPESRGKPFHSSALQSAQVGPFPFAQLVQSTALNPLTSRRREQPQPVAVGSDKNIFSAMRATINP
ncbi:MAG: hypothetical protein WCA11_00020, partial [Terracidiphilus sp.]